MAQRGRNARPHLRAGAGGGILMADRRTLELIERSAWIAIYAGMVAVILGLVSGSVHLIAGWSLGLLGAIAVAAGIALIVVRSRLGETSPPGAQSSPASQESSKT